MGQFPSQSQQSKYQTLGLRIIEKIFPEKVVAAGTGEPIEATHFQYEWIIFTSANGVSSLMRYVSDWIRNNNLESLEIGKAQNSYSLM